MFWLSNILNLANTAIRGGGIWNAVGRFAGKAFLKYLEESSHDVREYSRFKNIRESFEVNSARYGDAIALPFGYMKVIGKVIWSSNARYTATTNVEKKVFPGFSLN